jgi:hypothetical protein
MLQNAKIWFILREREQEIILREGGKTLANSRFLPKRQAVAAT